MNKNMLTSTRSRKRLITLTPHDLETCWMDKDFSAYKYVSRLNDQQVKKCLFLLDLPLCSKYKSAEDNNQNRQILSVYLAKQNEKFNLKQKELDDVGKTNKRSDVDSDADGLVQDGEESDTDNADGLLQGGEEGEIVESPCDDDQRRSVDELEIKRLEEEIKAMEEDPDLRTGLSMKEEKDVMYRLITTSETAVDLVQRYKDFDEQNVGGGIPDDEYYKVRHDKMYSYAAKLKELHPIPKDQTTSQMYPNFSTALDHVHDNLCAVNMYHNICLNEVFLEVKQLRAELDNRMRMVKKAEKDLSDRMTKLEGRAENDLSDRMTKLEGMVDGATKDNPKKRKGGCAPVETKKGAKKNTDIKYCSYKGCTRNSLECTILNQACEEHLELVREEERTRKARGKANNDSRRICVPVEGVGNNNLEKFLKMHTYYRDVVCPAMEVAGMMQQHYAHGGWNAHKALKEEGLTLLKNRIPIDRNMQQTLLKKLMAFEFTQGLFTVIDDNHELKPNEANRYVFLFEFM